MRVTVICQIVPSANSWQRTMMSSSCYFICHSAKKIGEKQKIINCNIYASAETLIPLCHKQRPYVILRLLKHLAEWGGKVQIKVTCNCIIWYYAVLRSLFHIWNVA